MGRRNALSVVIQIEHAAETCTIQRSIVQAKQAAKQGKADAKARQGKTSKAKSTARQDNAALGTIGHSKTRHGRARRCQVREGKARLGKTRK